MSRVGKLPVLITKGISVDLKGNHLVVKGPKGTLTRDLPQEMKIEIADNRIVVQKPHSNAPYYRSLYGLTRTLIFNMVKGVSEGFQKNLEVRGVGYRAQMQGNRLVLFVGYSHPVEYDPPEGITLEAPKPTQIVVRGINKELVGAVAAELRFVRKPEPYKGKGVRYEGEYVPTKVGKAGVSATAGAKK
ncbi:50S ribosomal protein L6 [candidate division FCPU426 bacterium]|nr:50S ribosomal protein L6 [candidate division FCPU426 bacterium]